MRNLKRALSLAMASVMTLGMMTVGTSAKGIADFSDAAEITNVDAVAVTSAIGIFKGYDDGEFKGENVVTRAEMAVICAKLLYGADVDPAQFAGAGKFTDTPAWAEGYINLCASLGIIAGRGNGIFDPSATVSTVEAASMLTKALGYFQNAKDYGEDWKLAVTAKATQLGLYGDLKLAADAGLTRDSVAELVFNTLTKAVPVQYNDLLGVYYNNNQGIIYALEYNYLETLGYKNFGLVYKTEENTMYGRPATTWGTGSYVYDKNATASGQKDNSLTAEGGLISEHVRMTDKNEIITVAKAADYSYTAETTVGKVYKALGETVCTEYDWEVYVNGQLVESVDKEYGQTLAKAYKDDKDGEFKYSADGAVTEFYIQDEVGNVDGKVTVVRYNYYMGEVSSTKKDDKGEYASIRALSKGGKDLKDKKFYTDEVEEDDLVLFTMDWNEEDKEYFIAEMFTPATATGKVSDVDDDNDSKKEYIKLNDESAKYYYASDDHNIYDVNDKDEDHPELGEEYVLFMTPTDFVVGYELVEETVDKYLWVKDSDEELKDWIAKVVLTDATTAKVEVKSDLKNYEDDKIEWISDKYYGEDVTNIDERIWKYSVNDKGVYTLTGVASIYDETAEYDINNGKAYVNETTNDDDFMVDKQTVFVDVKGGKSYVGYHNVPNIDNAEIAYVMDGKTAEVVFVLDGDIYDADSTYFVLTSDKHESREHEDELYRKYEKAYVNGEKETILVAYDAFKDGEKLEAGVVYKALKTVDEKYITEVEVAKAIEVEVEVEVDGEDKDIAVEKVDVLDVGDNAFWVVGANNETKFDTNDDTVFVKIEKSYDDDGDAVYAVDRVDIDDMFVGVDEDKLKCAVTVYADDDKTAELVYIFVAPNGDKYLTADGEGYAASFELVATVEAGGSAKSVKYAIPEDVAVGTEVLVKIIADENADPVKAATIYKAGYTYTVKINGKSVEAYCVENNELLAVVTIEASDFDAKGNVALALNIGAVKYVGETKELPSFIAENKDAATESVELVPDTLNGKEKIVLVLGFNEEADYGYYYSINCDASVWVQYDPDYGYGRFDFSVDYETENEVIFQVKVKDEDEDEDYEVHYYEDGMSGWVKLLKD